MSETTASRVVRPLHDWEIEEARVAFADSLDYARIRIHERVPWPDAIHRLGHLLRRMGEPPPDEHNAVTLGNHCHFPVSMPRQFSGPGDPFGMPWLVHELTHAWQYQHLGWPYLMRALWVQVRLGARGYDFGGAEGLRQARQNRRALSSFNMEQQGNIAMLYYIYQRSGRSAEVLDAFAPYIEELQKGKA